MSNFRNDDRSKIGGRCGKGWMEGPTGKCIRSNSKSSLSYGQRGEGVGETAKWLAKKTVFGSGDVEYNRRRSLGQGRRESALHGIGSGLKGHLQDTLLGGGVPLTPGGMVGGSIYRRSRNVGQGRVKAGLKGLAAGMAINVPLAIASTKAAEYLMQRQMAQQSQRTDAMKKPRCKKGKPCGAICIPKDSDCKEGDLYGHEIARYNQEFMAASLMGWTDKDGQPDTSKLKSMRPADRNMLLKAAQDYMTQNFKYDSAEVDTPAIKQEIEAAHGFRVDDIYRVQTRSDGALVGIGVSGGDFFEFDITNRSVGVVGRSDLTSSANERARGVLSASGIDYRGDSAFEYLRGREVRLDAPMQSNGQCGKGWKPGPGGKCVRGKGMGMAGKIGLGIAGAAALGGAAYAGRKQLSEAYLNVRSGAAGSQAKYEARKAATIAKRAAGKDARRAVKQGVSAVQGAAQQGASMAQGAANQAGREVRRAGVMARRAAGKDVRSAAKRAAGDVAATARGVGGQAGKVASESARRASVSARRAAGKDARRAAKQGMQSAQGAVQKVKQAPRNAVNAVDRAAVREMDEAGMRRVARNFGQSMQRTAREQRRSKSR